MYGELKDYKAAIEYYQKAKAIDRQYFQDYNLPYSINLAGNGQFQEALDAANEFLAVPGLSSSSIKAASSEPKPTSLPLTIQKPTPRMIINSSPGILVTASTRKFPNIFQR